MQIVYTGEPIPETLIKSIFLAGPTPRSPDVKSWRPEALKILEAKGYDGVVFVPEWRDGQSVNYDTQVDWEHKCLNAADAILFWVPRELTTMPAFTTNIEFGLWFNSGKVFLGAPPEAPKMEYLRTIGEKILMPQATDLNDLIDKILKFIGPGALRSKGEVTVPLHIWRAPSFKNWYTNLKSAGNALCDFKPEWSFMVGPNKNALFIWTARADIFITKENRHKTNDPVIARTDISTAVLYRRGLTALETEIVITKEFRSSVSNLQGLVYESAGGSSHNQSVPPRQVAADETFEETGLKIEPERLMAHSARQLMATFSAHRSYLFSAELTEEEIIWLKSQTGVPRGVDLAYNSTGERVYTEVLTLRQILGGNLVDWSNLGMLFEVLKDVKIIQ